MSSPTQRSLALCRENHWPADVVERWTGNVRRDLFGLFDVLAIRRLDLVGIQCCGRTGLAERRRKLADNALLAEWVLPSRSAEIWSWRRVKIQNKTRAGYHHRWEVHIERFNLRTYRWEIIS